MSLKINMLFTKNGNGVSTKPKTTQVHPQILKIMENSKNKPKNSYEYNPFLNIESNKKDFNFPAQPQIQYTNKKSFDMNFSQLTTSKPCGSCGGR